MPQPQYARKHIMQAPVLLPCSTCKHQSYSLAVLASTSPTPLQHLQASVLLPCSTCKHQCYSLAVLASTSATSATPLQYLQAPVLLVLLPCSTWKHQSYVLASTCASSTFWGVQHGRRRWCRRGRSGRTHCTSER
jgi:hypothetical protein